MGVHGVLLDQARIWAILEKEAWEVERYQNKQYELKHLTNNQTIHAATLLHQLARQSEPLP
jgi:hypothetical protein